MEATTETRKWIRAEHLTAATTARYHAAFEASPYRMVALDDFLTATAVTVLQERMRTASYETVYNLRQGGRCPRDAFEAAPEGERLGWFLEIDERPSTAAERSAERQLFSALSRAEALEFFGRLVGQPLNSVSALNCNAYERGHFLLPHTDSDGGRRLCAVIYLHAEWQPTFGGALVFERDLALPRRVKPLCNRIAIFDPYSGSVHAVEPVMPPRWQRWSITFWLI